MKKRLTVFVGAIAAAALSVALMAGCSGSGTSGEEAPAPNNDVFTLHLGFDKSYPPYGYVGDDGEFTGFDIELAKAVCEKLGWELDLQPIDWDTKDVLVNSGQINCIWNGFTMEGREDSYTFSEPYMYNAQVVVVKADSDMNALESLSGKSVITQVDSAALHVLEDEGGQKALADTFGSLDTIGDYNNAFMQLESGQKDAVACDLSIASYQMKAKPGIYKELGVLAPENYAVGFKMGDTELADQVTKALKELDEEGFVKELCAKYEDQGISYENWVLK